MSTTNNSTLAKQSKKIDASIMTVGAIAIAIILSVVIYVPISTALGL